MRNAINWFEIPATNFDRAVAFYSAVLGAPVHAGEFQGVPHGFLPADEGGVAGAIIAGAVVAGGDANPGHAGPVLYLNAGDQIEAIVARVEAAGGQVLAPPTPIGPQGMVAIFRDTEGNRVGLHQPPM
ncbi:VOC family protein [Oscillochloris sp. ZM17-4]|uniref:VOC family protein n=1 Tax=Oscillochloris sp. ZM17-4 TaxID=2866714 RepID=UPI001C73A4C8|nr:VOC family protein [Oscillochloris sp. ZM17-4]MBX0327499.1 VOC family protein [Oscillochloris sp. ZM17-4]